MGNCLTQALQTVQTVQEAAQALQDPQTTTTTTTGTPGSDDSPIHESLPAGAEKYMVRNVYDGDTLTLVDERRVRFLGIDTPEVKEKQPFAEEAKEYTKSRCHKKEIC